MLNQYSSFHIFLLTQYVNIMNVLQLLYHVPIYASSTYSFTQHNILYTYS